MPRRLPSLKAVLIALLPCVLVLGIVLGGNPRWLPDPVADALVGDEDARLVAEAFDEIADSYYRSVPREQLANDAIGGAVDGLRDRFSAYFTPAEYQRFEDQTNARFSGVGLAIRGVEDGLRVETVYDESPAEAAGIRVGDVIVEAAGKPLRGLQDEAATALIKGPPGSEVTLRVRRDDRTVTKEVTRATISIPVVASELERAGGERVSHIRLATFSSGAHGELNLAIRAARKRGAKGFVFDLRGNGGGLVSEAQLVGSAFLEDGAIVTTDGRSTPRRTLPAVGTPSAGELPVVVLVDGGTASASEIVAGALQDRDRAPVVGRPTFGKGVFQEIIELSNGGALDITAGQYFTPSGRNLGGAGTTTGRGIVPDVRAVDDPDTEDTDEALERALDVLADEL